VAGALCKSLNNVGDYTESCTEVVNIGVEKVDEYLKSSKEVMDGVMSLKEEVTKLEIMQVISESKEKSIH